MSTIESPDGQIEKLLNRLEKIEHNTDVIKGWLVFLGILSIFGFLYYLMIFLVGAFV